MVYHMFIYAINGCPLEFPFVLSFCFLFQDDLQVKISFRGEDYTLLQFWEDRREFTIKIKTFDLAIEHGVRPPKNTYSTGSRKKLQETSRNFLGDRKSCRWSAESNPNKFMSQQFSGLLKAGERGQGLPQRVQKMLGRIMRCLCDG